MALPHAGAGRHHDAAGADLLRHAAGMHRAAAAEGDHRAVGERLAALDRVDAGGVGHGLVHHLDHAGRRAARIHAQAGCRRMVQRGVQAAPASSAIVPPAKRAGS